MTRIRLAELDELEGDIRSMVEEVEAATGDSTALRVLAHRPDILKSFIEFYWPLQTAGLLSRKLIELVRLAVAQINQCPGCLSARYEDSIEEGLTEALVAKLPDIDTARDFSARERVAIRYARKMASNHLDVTDGDFIELHEHFSEGEIVELVMLVAMFIGIGRSFAAIDAMNPVCPIPRPAAAAG